MPDGENFVVAGSKQPVGDKEVDLDGSVRSSKSDSGYAKPVEELSYGLVLTNIIRHWCSHLKIMVL